MARTGKMSQHDRTVVAIGNKLRSQGWNVKASRVPFFKEPNTINGHVPDIDARRGRQRHIVEVETSHSMRTDVAQRRAFRSHAAKRPNTRYKTVVVKKRR